MAAASVYSRIDASERVPLAIGAQVIGDLHLDISNSVQVAKFCDYLKSVRGIPRLVILGDLFEYWVGPAQIDAAEVALDAMRVLTGSGTAIDIIPGNRDFLLESRFESRTGAVIRGCGFVGELPDGSGPERNVLLIHGDELCTLDVPYQRLRKVLRSGLVRRIATATPGPLARWMASRLRRASVQAIDQKPNLTMEQQPEACMQLAEQAECRTLICGHAHRFRDDCLSDGLRWLVVDAFGGKRDTLEVDSSGQISVRAKATP